VVVEFTDQEVAINLKLIKLVGFYRIFDVNGKIMFDWNVYRLSITVYIVIILCAVMFGIFGLFMDIGNISNDFDFILLHPNGHR